MTTTFPQYPDDPRGSFILRCWEERARAGEHVRVLAPRTAWCRESVSSVCEVRRFSYAPKSLSSLSGQYGIVENVRHRPWRALLVAPFWLSLSKRLRLELRDFRPDRVIAHWLLPGGWLAARECVQAGVPFEVFAHGTDVDLLLLLPAALQRRFAQRLAHATRVSFPSQEKLERFRAAPSLRACASLSVEPMVAWADCGSVDEVAVEYREGVLFLGRLTRQKGVDDLLEALALLPERPRLDVAGDGPERKRLERRARRLGISAKFHGFVEGARKHELLRRTAVLCVPSKMIGGLSEGAPLVIPEAISRGTRVVASDVGGIAELCAGVDAVRLVPPGNPRLLAWALSAQLKAAGNVQPTAQPH